jgi:hypothetical protein
MRVASRTATRVPHARRTLLHHGTSTARRPLRYQWRPPRGCRVPGVCGEGELMHVPCTSLSRSVPGVCGEGELVVGLLHLYATVAAHESYMSQHPSSYIRISTHPPICPPPLCHSSCIRTQTVAASAPKSLAILQSISDSRALLFLSRRCSHSADAPTPNAAACTAACALDLAWAVSMPP